MPAVHLRPLVVLAVMLAAAMGAIVLKPVPRQTEGGTGATLESMIPEKFADWSVDRTQFPIPLTPELQATIDRIYDETLERSYVDSTGHLIMLSIAYASRSEKGIQTHRPEICYPAQGFTVVKEGEPIRLATSVGPIDATRLVARRGTRNEPITYWVVVGGEQTRFGFSMRWLQVRNGLLGVIPDGTLMRVSSIGPDAATEYDVQKQFVAQFVTGLGADGRLRVLGEALPGPATVSAR